MSRQSLSPEMIKNVKNAILHKMVFALGVEPRDASKRNWLNATLRVVRDLSTEDWLQTAVARLQMVAAVFITFQWNF